MKKVFKKNNKGFTLIELLIYMGISTIIVVVLTSFMADVLKNAAKTKITKEVQQNARFITAKITQEIRNAQSINIDTFDLTLNNKTLFSLKDDGVYYDDDVSDADPALKLTSNQVKINRDADPNDPTQYNSQFKPVSGTVFIKLTVEQASPNARRSESSQITLSSAAVPRASLY
ncbi:MAG: prepilin-type N-terminal cleavage/methylation domain-containing protein [Patescibacteria group bacterium]